MFEFRVQGNCLGLSTLLLVVELGLYRRRGLDHAVVYGLQQPSLAVNYGPFDRKRGGGKSKAKEEWPTHLRP